MGRCIPRVKMNTGSVDAAFVISALVPDGILCNSSLTDQAVVGAHYTLYVMYDLSDFCVSFSSLELLGVTF